MTPNQIAMFALSGLVVTGFGFVLITWMIWPPTTHSDVLSALVGGLAAGYLQVLTYWFGRSKDGT